MSWEYWICVVFAIPVVVYFFMYKINWQWEGFDRFKKKNKECK